MNNTERDEKIATLETRKRKLQEAARKTDDWQYKNELYARAGGIEEALQYFRPESTA